MSVTRSLREPDHRVVGELLAVPGHLVAGHVEHAPAVRRVLGPFRDHDEGEEALGGTLRGGEREHEVLPVGVVERRGLDSTTPLGSDWSRSRRRRADPSATPTRSKNPMCALAAARWYVTPRAPVGSAGERPSRSSIPSNVGGATTGALRAVRRAPRARPPRPPRRRGGGAAGPPPPPPRRPGSGGGGAGGRVNAAMEKEIDRRIVSSGVGAAPIAAWRATVAGR